MATLQVPELDLDLFTDEALINPYPLYEEIRATASAVFLPKYGVWAMGRYDDVRAALADWETFTSTQGVALNPTSINTTRGIIITTDPPEHDVLRGVLADRLAPRAIRALQGGIEEQARELVDSLVAKGSFNAVTELARVFPVTVVLQLIGLPADTPGDRVLAWAEAAFNAGGPDIERTREAFPLLADQFAYLAEVSKEKLEEGSFGWAIYDAADKGVIPHESCVPLLSAYVTAGMDTTINAISTGIQYFAENPEQWDLVRADRTLITSAFHEIVRMESPLQWFARVTTRDVDLGDVVIPEGERVLMLYGSANRDERKWEDPTRFDVKRNPVDHLAFGYGTHGCAGQGLARLEGTAIFKALADTVVRFDTAGADMRLNNRIRGLDSLEVTVTPVD